MDGIGRFFCALVAIKELSLWSMDSINCATAPFYSTKANRVGAKF